MPVTTVGLVGPVPHELRLVSDPGLPQCLSITLETLLRGVRRAQTIDEADPAVVAASKILVAVRPPSFSAGITEMKSVPGA